MRRWVHIHARLDGQTDFSWITAPYSPALPAKARCRFPADERGVCRLSESHAHRVTAIPVVDPSFVQYSYPTLASEANRSGGFHDALAAEKIRMALARADPRCTLRWPFPAHPHCPCPAPRPPSPRSGPGRLVLPVLGPVPSVPGAARSTEPDAAGSGLDRGRSEPEEPPPLTPSVDAPFPRATAACLLRLSQLRATGQRMAWSGARTRSNKG